MTSITPYPQLSLSHCLLHLLLNEIKVQQSEVRHAKRAIVLKDLFPPVVGTNQL